MNPTTVTVTVVGGNEPLMLRKGLERRMPKPVNLAGVEFYELDEIEVGEFHPLPNGEGDPTQVHLNCRLKGFPAAFVVRFKSGRAVDELIVALITHRKGVFGDANNERV